MVGYASRTGLEIFTVEICSPQQFAEVWRDPGSFFRGRVDLFPLLPILKRVLGVESIPVGFGV